MSDRYRYVRPGQPLRGGFSAEGWNAALRAAKEADLRRLDVRSTPQAWDDRNATIVKVRNDTGSDLGRFSVINLDEPLIGPGDNQDEFDSYFAMSATHSGCGFFAILQEPLAVGEIGRAVVAGISRATVNMLKASHKFAKPDPGSSTRLVSSDDTESPGIILWSDDDGSGDFPAAREALVLVVGAAPNFCGSAACTDEWLCVDNVLTQMLLCGTGVEVGSTFPNCCGTGSAGSSETPPLCLAPTFAISVLHAGFGSGPTGDPSQYNCAPIDKYCLTGPRVHGGCSDWTGSSSYGSVTVTKCGQTTCITILDPNGTLLFQDCKPNPRRDPCSMPQWGDVSISPIFGIPDALNATTSLTIAAEGCGPKCWQHNVTGHKFCSGSDETAIATAVGTYTDNADCALHCFDWGCWQSNSLPPTDPGYRYCANTDETATATLVATYLDEAVCADNCGAWYCVQWLDCDDDACTENCHPTTTVFDPHGNFADYPFCTDLASVLGGCFSNSDGGFTHYQIVDGPFGHPDCDSHCDPIT